MCMTYTAILDSLLRHTSVAVLQCINISYADFVSVYNLFSETCRAANYASTHTNRSLNYIVLVADHDR